jgi:hypothetical protein
MIKFLAGVAVGSIATYEICKLGLETALPPETISFLLAEVRETRKHNRIYGRLAKFRKEN